MNEKSRKTRISLLCFTALGVAIGWTSNSYLSETPKAKQQSAATKVDLDNTHASKKITTAPPNSNKQIATKAALSKHSEVPSEEEILLESIINDSSDAELTAARIIDYLALKLEQGHFNIAKERVLRKLLRGTPEINFALIDQYSTINEPQTRFNLGNLLAQSNLAHQPFLEPKFCLLYTSPSPRDS